jgi:hypothetical protein
MIIMLDKKEVKNLKHRLFRLKIIKLKTQYFGMQQCKDIVFINII